MNVLRSAIAALLCALLAGCISPKSFVDPSQPKLSYNSLARPAAPLKLSVTVEFQRQGEPFPKAEPTLRDNTDRILRATGVILPSNDNPAGSMRVTVNNTGDRAAAAAKGFATGLTFGLAGNTVTDNYELTMSITINGKTVTRSTRHALHTAIGNTDLPKDVETVPPNVAFERVLEQMLLRALQEMQKAGELAHEVPQLLLWDFTMMG
jgi:hypothetical protein